MKANLMKMGMDYRIAVGKALLHANTASACGKQSLCDEGMKLLSWDRFHSRCARMRRSFRHRTHTSCSALRLYFSSLGGG
ncbi:hypothetical protein [Bacteroides pyogenes]|uniref:hypothetical protein n=1 Tax=Bacteroides pyogenes TaxID=310300 RepID=UPI002A80B3E4|nr:hypothetical protein [Bacteroides pyogenes]MDY4250715.1 hypothetical protein [Bacteroides pyogenes]